MAEAIERSPYGLRTRPGGRRFREAGQSSADHATSPPPAAWPWRTPRRRRSAAPATARPARCSGRSVRYAAARRTPAPSRRLARAQLARRRGYGSSDPSRGSRTKRTPTSDHAWCCVPNRPPRSTSTPSRSTRSTRPSTWSAPRTTRRSPGRMSRGHRLRVPAPRERRAYQRASPAGPPPRWPARRQPESHSQRASGWP